MRIIKGLGISFGVGVFTAVGSAIVLTVVNIYLSGQGNKVLSEDYFNGPILYGGIDDLILIILTIIAAIIAFAIYWKASSPSPKQ